MQKETEKGLDKRHFCEKKDEGDYCNLVQEANLFLILSLKSADFLSYKQR